MLLLYEFVRSTRTFMLWEMLSLLDNKLQLCSYLPTKLVNPDKTESMNLSLLLSILYCLIFRSTGSREFAP